MASLFSLELGGNWRCRKEMRSTILKTGKGRKKGGRKKSLQRWSWCQMTPDDKRRSWKDVFVGFAFPLSSLDFSLPQFLGGKWKARAMARVYRAAPAASPMIIITRSRFHFFIISNWDRSRCQKSSFSLLEKVFSRWYFFRVFEPDRPLLLACVRACVRGPDDG